MTTPDEVFARNWLARKCASKSVNPRKRPAGNRKPGGQRVPTPPVNRGAVTWVSIAVYRVHLEETQACDCETCLRVRDRIRAEEGKVA